jgi:hypothetical protein
MLSPVTGAARKEEVRPQRQVKRYGGVEVALIDWLALMSGTGKVGVIRHCASVLLLCNYPLLFVTG